MTNDEINKRVAVLLGWRAVRDSERDVYRGSVLGSETEPCIVGVSPYAGGNAGMPMEIPDFCTSPYAADLVRLEIERRGWGMRLNYPCVGIVGADERGWSCFIWDDAFEEFSCGKPSPHMALCLAFLSAACEATAAKEQEEVTP